MSKVVDARGLSCPQPVLLAKKALEETTEVLVIVDNEASAQNLRHMGQQQGCEVRVDQRADGIYVHLKRLAAKPSGACEAIGLGAVLVVPSECMGRGEEELGRLLMRSFLHTLAELRHDLRKAIFFNTGVKLVVEGSDVLDDLRVLEEKGVEILACGTCLDYFGLKGKQKVGRVSNMYEIAEALLAAQKLIVL